jgi:hypothetical protein
VNVGLPSETIRAAALRIKQLERENAALRADNQAAHALVLDLRAKEHSERTLAVKLEKENAALRALLLRTADALESEIEADERKGTWHNHAALAAARKEQP